MDANIVLSLLQSHEKNIFCWFHYPLSDMVYSVDVGPFLLLCNKYCNTTVSNKLLQKFAKSDKKSLAEVPS